MDPDSDPQHRRVPTLVHLCQRVAISNLDAIHSLGDLPYSLVQPILARCTTEQLSRFEQLSPHLERDTSEIWRDLCFREYHLTAVERFSPNDDPHPDSWRSRFLTLQELEAKRIEEVGAKIRIRRLEAEERKKEKEIKLTDRLPPAKRQRTGGFTQPKTLFQKTRTEASKIQRVFNARILPPPRTRIHRPPPRVSGSSVPSAVSPSDRVHVESTSVHHRPSNPNSTIASASNSKPMVSDVDLKKSSTDDLLTTPPAPSQTTHLPIEATSLSSPSGIPRPLPKIRTPAKRDPMASLFVPKRKPPPHRPA